MLRRALRFLVHRRRAARFGIGFTRARELEIPTSILLGGVRQPLDLPDEWGTVVAVYDLLLDDVYRLERMRGVQRVLDIGAHAGLFCVAARARFPDAEIHAYEPNPLLHDKLRHQARIVGATWFPEAVGASEGRVRMVPHPQSYFFRVEPDPKSEVRQVMLETALERIGGSADLVKLDAEGAEWELLADPRPWRAVRYVTLEYHGRSVDELYALLRAAGFESVDHQPLGDHGLVFARRPSRPRLPV